MVWQRYPEGGSKLLAMLALADWAGDDGGRIYPSMKTLADKIRMSERQTARIVYGLCGLDPNGKALPEDKRPAVTFLELLTAENKGGRTRSNRYRIKLETLSNCPIQGAETLTFQQETLSPVSLNPVIAMTGEPLDPLIEPSPPPTAGTRNASIKSINSEWQSTHENKIDTLRKYIETLEKAPPGFAPPGEVTRARNELDELTGETEPYQDQMQLSAGNGQG
jgi:hypothetical protein